MHGIIIYTSRYGSTKQYAEWLREETGFDLCEARRCPADLRQYDLVVLGSSVFAGHLSLAKWIQQHWASLQGKRLLLMLTNMTGDREVLAKVVPQSLPEEMAQALTLFPVGGRYILDRMSWLHRTMIKMVAKAQKDPKVQQEMLTDKYEVRKENLQEILSYIRQR